MTTTETLRGWISGRLPQDWFTQAPDVIVDRDEIHIVGTLPQPTLPDAATDVERDAAAAGAAKAFREATREQRIEIARELERTYDLKVAWGVRVGDRTEMFTQVAVPVMTRLRQKDRLVLDTLVAAGVARSRSDALAWCVRLVGQHEGDWLAELREAMTAVDAARAKGPSV
jgi:hypothetical protein